jgi:thiamine biosynthesis lipoprotein
MSDPGADTGSFGAMSTTVTLTGVGIDASELRRGLALARTLVATWETRFSRFRPDSEISRLNAAGSRPVQVSAAVLDLLQTMRDAVIRTGGAFDPSVLPALEAAGYTETIDRVRASPAIVPREPIPAAGIAGWREVVIDRERSEAALPAGMRIDPGGIAKGAFVDVLAAQLRHWPGGCVDAGGDLRVWGDAPAGGAWIVGIEDPARPGRDLAAVRIDRPGLAAVATSSPNRRRWMAAGAERHHLIDPATGVPLAGRFTSATAFAPTVTAAEIATKAILVASARGTRPDRIDSTLAACVTRDGELEFLEGPHHGHRADPEEAHRRPA